MLGMPFVLLQPEVTKLVYWLFRSKLVHWKWRSNVEPSEIGPAIQSKE